MKPLRTLVSIALVCVLILSFALPASAFCGFYVAKADIKLYNKASQVVIARDSNRTVLTMANDFQGDIKDFAIVIPVPVLLTHLTRIPEKASGTATQQMLASVPEGTTSI